MTQRNCFVWTPSLACGGSLDGAPHSLPSVPWRYWRGCQHAGSGEIARQQSPRVGCVACSVYYSPTDAPTERIRWGLCSRHKSRIRGLYPWNTTQHCETLLFFWVSSVKDIPVLPRIGGALGSFILFVKYALVRSVSAITRCDGGLSEGSYVHETAWYILELHQSNVSTSWVGRASCQCLDVRSVCVWGCSG